MVEVGHIFVAWGGNKPLADAVVDRLRKGGKNAVLGGDEQEPNRSSYLGERVREQILSASAVIVLVENSSRHYGDSVKALPPEFRPNLMFEWGFALATFPRNLVSPALIGVKREQLPSDLVGIWAPTYDHYDPTSKIDVKRRAFEIAGSFIKYLSTVATDLPTTPADGVCKWPATEIYLHKIVAGRRSILSTHLQLTLPNIVIPAIYDGRSEELRRIIKSKITNGEVPEMRLVSRILDYYSTCEQRPENIESLRRLRRDFDGLCKMTFASPWARPISYNFLGVIERKIATRIHADTRNSYALVAAAREYLNEARRQFASASRSSPNDDQSGRIWEGFVLFNLAKTYKQASASDDKTKFVELIEEANACRRQIYQFVRDSGTSHRIEAEFLCEWLACELELTRGHAKANEALVGDVLAEARQLLRANSRAIGRLMSQLKSYLSQYSASIHAHEIIELDNVLSRR